MICRGVLDVKHRKIEGLDTKDLLADKWRASDPIRRGSAANRRGLSDGVL